MMIASYVPDLTPAEASRFWMTPVEVCRLAAIGEQSDPKVKKLLNTLSDREHLPFVKSGTGKTAPRLYSLASAAMLRTIVEVIEDGRTYVYAAAVAETVRKGLIGAAERIPHLNEFDRQFGEARVLFSGMTAEGEPSVNRWARRGDVYKGWKFTYSYLDAGYLIFRVCGNYADFWARDIEARGKV